MTTKRGATPFAHIDHDLFITRHDHRTLSSVWCRTCGERADHGDDLVTHYAALTEYERRHSLRHLAPYIVVAKDGTVVAEFVRRRQGGYEHVTGLRGPFRAPRRQRPSWSRGQPVCSWRFELEPLAMPDGARIYRYASKACDHAMAKATKAAA